ncbi:insulinase family protein [Antarcticibacterium arcticum]|uniref:Insulinase family protein n=1 Tax=Antarcticibacterium arcticum TaxID=2585771 RepID=A0A5B8YNE6_9FLAO|nr:insulinase family protein [Antarcticibacterium arcticum]QED37776.1 insulinase family protein [Antarcticibacterium arcticum]
MKIIIYLYLLLGVSNGILAQNNDKAPDTGNSNFSILTGKLDNGLSYIIKPLEGDTGKIEANLVVHAGANQEDTDQYYFAHLLEHLAAGYTENFPSLRSNVELFSQFKISPQDYTASVGEVLTGYKIQYHQEFPQTLDTIFSMFYDIVSGKVLFDENIVHTEKKALYQEYLYSETGKSYPEYKGQNLLSGCRDFIPSPGNFESVLMKSSLESLKQFYLDWYRPDLMTIYVVGNIKDVALIQNKIKEKFGDIKNSTMVREKKNCGQTYLNRPKQFIVQEKSIELPENLPAHTTFQFYYRNKSSAFPQFSQDENKVLWDILTKMISNRLKSQQPDYNQEYTIHFNESIELPARLLNIKTFDNNPLIIAKVFEIIAGISAYGFTQDELNKVVQESSKTIQARDYTSVPYWSKTIYNSLTYNEPVPLSKDSIEIEFLNQLKINHINDLIRKHMDWMPDDIALIFTNDFKKNIFTEKNIKKWIKKGLSQPAKYQSKVIPEQFLSSNEISELRLVPIIKHKSGIINQDIIELENGVKIILKENNPSTDRITGKLMVHGFSPIGASCFGEMNFNALFAPAIIQNSGVGKYDKFTIDKILANTSLPFGMNNYIEQWETGVKAEILPQDLEILMQLIYLSFSTPRFDLNAFEDWKIQEQKKSIRNSSPNNDFVDFINKKAGFVKLPQGVERLKEIRNVDYKKAFKKYKLLHANAANFTFIITGNFNKNEILPILQRYLGNLPKDENNICIDQRKDEAFPLTDAHFILPKSVDNNFLSIQFVSPLPINSNYKDEIEIEFLKQALVLKLRDLRNTKNLGVYFASAFGFIDYHKRTKTIQIYLQSDREDFNQVLEACNILFEELKTSKVSPNSFSTIKESGYFPKWQNESSSTHRSISHTLYDFYRFEVPIIESNQAKEFINSFTAEDLLKVANNYFNEEFRVTYIGSPEFN